MEYLNKFPQIICICGKARSGKNTVGQIICNYYKKAGEKVIISQYTKYLKQYIREIYNIKITDNNKPRTLLQDISANLIKNTLNDYDFFIRRQIEDIKIYSYFFNVIVINDVRFPQEILKLKEKFPNVISIGVTRPDYNNGLSKKEQNDITETALDNYHDFDYELTNLNEKKLTHDVQKIITEIVKRKRDNLE